MEKQIAATGPRGPGLPYREVTEQVIGCAFRVYNRMGSGFLESVYQRCMVVELRRAGLAFESQKPIAISYDGEPVGEFIADLLVEQCVLVELKVVRELAEVHEAQLVNYLTATGIEVGLLLNFGERGVEVRRKYRTYRPRATAAASVSEASGGSTPART